MGFNFLTLTKTELTRLIASFILGVIIGATLLNLFVGHQIDQLIYEKEELKSNLKNQTAQLEQLEESLAEERKKIIQKLQVKIETDLDKHITQELKQKIFNLLKSLIGREIDTIDGNLIAETLDGRIIIIEGNEYQLDLLWFMIQPEAIVSFEIKKE
ncbi:DUF1664 domain-containing protein [Natroniella sulfidigena]|uniref:DUF1664 domain-containing protein n=1 Tax=Natroniella sulfidigena TaxID=723921 RepID=UPI00200AB605|nr:DUF1664 domain-containing protein [Natroniella sulfidigena]MCK8817912.1 DUF1664 domain-containing protein [Natroniella sulfidigena]